MKNNKGFTLIELLVVISIMGIIMGLSIFGLLGARESARDGRRKADIEEIRASVEIYKSDCNSYPSTISDDLVGDDSPTACSADNVYIDTLPVDPITPDADYLYWSNGTTYEICAYLEQVTGDPVTCGGSTVCGGSTCNYKATNP